MVYNKAVEASLHRNMVSNLLEKMGKSKQHYFPLLYCPAIPHPLNSITNKLIEGDVLEEILKKKKVRVGTVKADWGFAGNYFVNPPVGFFPSITTDIVTLMGEIINEPLEVEWVQMAMNDIIPSLDNDTIHMTDTYFLYPAVITEGKGANEPRMDHYFQGCPVCSSNSFMVLKKSSNINSLTDLGNAIAAATDDRDKKVFFLSKANYDVVIHLLPRQIIGSFKRNPHNARTEIFTAVQSGEGVGGIFSSPTDSKILQTYDLKQISLDINIAHGPWFK